MASIITTLVPLTGPVGSTTGFVTSTLTLNGGDGGGTTSASAGSVLYLPETTFYYTDRGGLATATSIIYTPQTALPITTTDSSTTSNSTVQTPINTKAVLSSLQGLPSATEFGLGVGIALGVTLLLLGTLLFMARKRRQRRNTRHTQAVSEVDDSAGKIVGAATTTTSAERSKAGIGKSAGGSTKRWDKPELEDNALPRTHGRAELEGDSKVGRSPGGSDGMVTRQGEMEGSSSEGAKNLHNNINIVDEKERLYEI